MVWDWMKDYIEDKYGLVEATSYNQLHYWVKEAWREPREGFLAGLIASMHDRCEADIQAGGMHGKLFLKPVGGILGIKINT
ncbi:hypothetical protein CH63R_05616 [Colletotrichum higginsianum IMI 349063]|uniref:Uncharacterized protein n=1 Tax=Colletotrichum higginsianum (strain IMI 349063) TaxID=759273 RepID=A0A1B7YDE4_COLHI|nr:hypothetical protein CH63R_05616 [Colletotrichum higginsianum IMI 349063]OBR09924.1 hypothetical protein CH63R_05616 [Colletotrichum higginsianum IMI 349063]